MEVLGSTKSPINLPVNLEEKIVDKKESPPSSFQVPHYLNRLENSPLLKFLAKREQENAPPQT